MARKQTGLRNRYRSGGRSTYSVKKKYRVADRYGQPAHGEIEDIICGYRVRYEVGHGKG